MFLLLPLVLLGCGGLFGESEPNFIKGGPDGFHEDCGGDWEDPVRPDFGERLDPSGCQYRITAMDTSLRLQLDVPVFADALAEGSASAVYTLPDDTVRLTVEQGCNLSAGWCDTEGSPTIFDTFTPTGGTVTVSADETSGETLATVAFEGVTFESAMGALLAMDPLTWTDVRLYAAEE